MMDVIKPDQERVKNLLLDTVTLLCKNSLQFENYLRVEGLLGVAVDDKDTFFLHISERFQSDAYIERQKQEREEKEAEARREQVEKEEAEQATEHASEDAENASQNACEALAIKVKMEARDQEDQDDDDLVITGSSSLNSPQTVARSATMVAGQRRAQRRMHSPSLSIAHNQSDSANYYHTQQSSPFVLSDNEEGDSSYSQCDSNQSIKTEQRDGPPAKRQAMSNMWPNVSLGDLSMQAAQASLSNFGDGSFAGDASDPSEPGCSAWPTNVQLQQSGSQDPIGWPVSKLEAEIQRRELSLVLPYPSFQGPCEKMCEVCGKTFERLYNYYNHMRTHTGDRPYICSICPYRAKSKSNLNSHLKHSHRNPADYRSHGPPERGNSEPGPLRQEAPESRATDRKSFVESPLMSASLKNLSMLAATETESKVPDHTETGDPRNSL